MTQRSDRLRPAARKYRLDRILAERTLAQLVQRYRTLLNQQVKLTRAGNRSNSDSGDICGCELAAEAEWSARIAAAAAHLAPTVEAASAAVNHARIEAARTKRRCDIVARSIEDCRKAEARLIDGKMAVTGRRWARGDDHP